MRLGWYGSLLRLESRILKFARGIGLRAPQKDPHRNPDGTRAVMARLSGWPHSDAP